MELSKLESNEYIQECEYVIDYITTRLQNVNMQLSDIYGRNIIHQISSRIKSIKSTEKKLCKKKYEVNYNTALLRIHDLIGVRAVCSFTDDIYHILDSIYSCDNIKVIKVKDYIKKPKKSGYRSLHLILQIPTEDCKRMRKVEVQLRTSAMDFWADLDHQLRYKKGKREGKLIGAQLKEYSKMIRRIDEKMLDLRTQIEEIE